MSASTPRVHDRFFKHDHLAGSTALAQTHPDSRASGPTAPDSGAAGEIKRKGSADRTSVQDQEALDQALEAILFAQGKFEVLI